MFFIILIAKVLTFAATALAADSTAVNPKRALQKSLLKNLSASHSGNDVPKDVRKYDLSGRDSTYSHDDLHEIPLDLQIYIFAFLGANYLSKTMLISPLYYNLSNAANIIFLNKQNPNLVLEENWMNMVLADFLQKHFEKGILNLDDLFMVIYGMNFKLKQEEDEDQNPDDNSSTLDLMTFLYELEKGPNSYIPYLPVDFLAEIVRTHAKQPLPKSLRLTDAYFLNFAIRIDINERLYMSIVRRVFNFMISKSNAEEIKHFLSFDPAQSISTSLLEKMPHFMKFALFDLILPLSNDERTFREVFEIMRKTFAFSQTFFDLVDSKFPQLMNEINGYVEVGLTGILPPLRKAHIKRFPRPDIIGLDYLVTRNSTNPFDLNELKAMNPDYELVIMYFLHANTMTLTELDMICQMNEAGLFDGIANPRLRGKINALLTGKSTAKTYMLALSH